MPLYDFKNNQTGDVEEIMVSLSDYDRFIEDNPHLTRVVGAPMLSQRVNMHKRMDGGFKDVLRKAKAAHPLGTIDV